MKKPTDEQKVLHPEVNDMMDDLSKISAVKAMADSEGGQIIVQSLVSDVISAMDTLCVKYSSMSLQEFISLCADMKSKIDLARVITRSNKNKKALENMIEETLQE